MQGVRQVIGCGNGVSEVRSNFFEFRSEFVELENGETGSNCGYEQYLVKGFANNESSEQLVK